MADNKFIAFEGIDGCGKTTQVRLMKEYFDKVGLTYVICELGQVEELKQLLKKLKQRKRPLAKSLSLLFALDHALQNELIIALALVEGKWVVADRSIYSTMAYNAALEVDDQWLIDLYRDFIKPDHVFLLDIRPEEAYKRERYDPLATGFSDNWLEYQMTVRRFYHKYATMFGFVTIDGRKDKQAIHLEVINTLKLLP